MGLYLILFPHQHQLGTVTGVPQVKWPPYFEPMLSDIEMATRSAIAAKVGGVIDRVQAVKFVAPYFKIEDPAAMMVNIENEQQEEQNRLAEQALGMLHAPGVPGQPPGGGE